MKNNVLFWVIVLFVSLSGLLAGFDTGVVSGALLFIGQSFDITPELSGFLVSSVSIGAIIGAFINGVLIDKCGRKNVLLLSAMIFLFGSVCCAFATNIYQLIAFRGFIGCAVGIVSFAAPLYLSEISTKDKRGAVVSFYQIAITLGILFSYLINYVFANSSYTWRNMLFMGAIPAFVFFIGMFFQKDTPRWYVLKSRFDDAKAVMQRFCDDDSVDIEIENICSTIQQNEKFVLNKKLIMPFFIAIGLMFAQVATGINAIIYYAPTIFKNIGFSTNEGALAVTIFIGVINFLMTFVAIAFVDKWGRKPLLYIGLAGMLLSLFVLASVFIVDWCFLKYVAVVACTIYIISFSMSLGPVALLINSEIFPLKYRGLGMSIAIVSNFLFNFFVTFCFPISLSRLGGFVTFMIFACTCLLSLLFVFFVVPETKGKSLEEIEKKWD